MTILYTKRLH